MGKGEGRISSWLSGGWTPLTATAVVTFQRDLLQTSVFFLCALCRCDITATAASKQPITESVYVDDTVH